MSLNLFFYVLPVVVIACISLPNHIIDTSKCTRHWIAILTIVSCISGLLGFKELSITILVIIGVGISLTFLHKYIKEQGHIEIK